MPKIKSLHQVRCALSQPPPLLANPALSLANWTATTTTSNAAAGIVPSPSHSHVSMTTGPQPLGLDSGRCHFVLNKAVVERVGVVIDRFELNTKGFLPQVLSPLPTTPTTIQLFWR